MLANLFKPKWRHKRADVRCKAVASLDSQVAEQRAILVQLVQADPDQSVRDAALQKLDQIDCLIELAPTIPAALEKLSLYIEKHPQQVAADADLIAQLWQLELPAAIIEQLLNDMDAAQLLNLAINAPYTNHRQQAAERLHSEAELAQLVKESKGKDKRVNQIAKEKLQHIRTEEKQLQAQNQIWLDLCDAIEQHSRTSYNSLYSGKLQHLVQQWQQQSESPNDTLQQRFEQARLLAQVQIDEHLDLEREKQQELVRQQQATSEQLATCQELEQCIEQLRQGDIDESGSQIKALLDIQIRRWQDSLNDGKPHPKEALRFDQASKLLGQLHNAVTELAAQQEPLQKILAELAANEDLPYARCQSFGRDSDKICRRIDWPEAFTLPAALQQLQQQRLRLDELQGSIKQRQSEHQKAVKQQMKELAAAIDSGAIAEAQAAQKTIGKHLPHLAPVDAHKQEAKLRLLNAQLGDLMDWRQYATHPKQEALVNAMQALIDADLPALEKADAIKELQQQWKGLGGSHSAATQQLWQQFKAAADQAFEPCRAYYEDQRQRRDFNRQQRELLCQELEQFYANNDWDATDWPGVLKVLDTAKQEWKRFSPVERDAHKPLQQRFDDVLKPINDKLQNESERNAQRKREMVLRAQELVTIDDLHAAIEETKQLQKQWSDKSFILRRTDQKLWKQFRAACDLIFARREQERLTAAEQQEQNLAVAEQIVERMATLASNEPTTDITSEQFAELNQAFEAVGALPKAKAKSVRSQFRQACERYQKQQSQLQLQERQQVWHEAARKAKLCQQLEYSDGSDSELLDRCQQQWEEGTIALEKSLLPLMQQRWQQAVAHHCEGLDKDWQEIDNQRRLLCIRMEIAAEVESPAEDSQTRMEYQVERLSQGLSQRHQFNGGSEIEQIQLQWYSCPAASAELQQQLDQRFDKALQALANSAPEASD